MCAIRDSYVETTEKYDLYMGNCPICGDRYTAFRDGDDRCLDCMEEINGKKRI